MSKNVFCLVLACGLLVSGTAFATECTPEEEAEAGKIAGGLVRNVAKKVMPTEGKQMINVSACEVRGGAFTVDVKYNVLGSDGLYWVTAQTKFGAGGSNPNVKITKTSPTVAAAEAKTGVKISSN